MKHRLFSCILLFLTISCNLHASKISYTYDSIGRLTQVSYDDGTFIDYNYDKASNLLYRLVGPNNQPGDIFDDSEVNLKDAIVSLQVLTGVLSSGILLSGDVNGDHKINQVETLFVLKMLAGYKK